MNSTARVYKATGAKLFWNMIWARAYPRIVGTMRERSWVLFETLLPLLGTAGFVYVYKSLDAKPEFIGFAVLGGAMTAFWINVLWSMAAQLYWDKDAGNLELYVLSPGSLMAVLIGMSVGGLFMAATRAVTIIVVCSLLFGVTYTVSSWALLILAFLLTMTALYGMGMMFASVFLATGREAWHMVNLLQEPIYLVSGFYFPVANLHAIVYTAASVIPLTLGMDAMRQLIFSGSDVKIVMDVTMELLILGVLSVIFIYGANGALKKLEQIGRREGRLIERRK